MPTSKRGSTDRECCDCRALPNDQRPAKPRPIAGAGPRCATHARQAKRERAAKAHARHVRTTYGLPDGLYDAILEAQGGVCAWCQRATGKSRKLAVDHDHSCCPGSKSCGKCARGLLCASCNQFMGYQMRDNPDAIKRGARYLSYPPAQAVILAWGT